MTQSTHKVATALSQGSLLLLNDASRIESLYEQVNELGLVSTSFSYPILASLELGVRQLVHEGERIWSQTIARAESFRYACRTLPGITCFGREEATQPGFKDLDRTRVTIDVRRHRTHGVRRRAPTLANVAASTPRWQRCSTSCFC